MTALVYMPKGHDLESFLYSLAQEGVSSEQPCLDGSTSDTLNSTPIASKSYKQESKTGLLTMPLFSETSEILSRRVMREPTLDTSMSSAQASRSPASHFPSQESEQEQTTTEICGPPLSTPYAQYDLDTLTWKMCQGWLLPGISEPSWETWPKAGMTVDGAFYPQPKWERRISETGSGLLLTPRAQEPGRTNIGYGAGLNDYVNGTRPDRWPTPTVNMVSGGANHNSPSVVAGKHGLNIAGAVNKWPTPAARDYNDGNYPSEHKRHTPGLAVHAGGKLNPDWVEWIMGWPLGWTSLEPLPIESFEQWNVSTYWDAEPDIPRTANGIVDRVSRLKAIGNGQVSATAAAAWMLLT